MKKTRCLLLAAGTSLSITGLKSFAVVSETESTHLLETIRGAREGVSPFVEHVIRPEYSIGQAWNVRLVDRQSLMAFDALNGKARIVPAELLTRYVLTDYTFDEVVRVSQDVIRENKDLFEIEVDQLSVNKNSVLIDSKDQLVSFNVIIDGLVVEDATIQFRFKNGVLSNVINASYTESTRDVRTSQPHLEKIAQASVMGSAHQYRGDSLRVVSTDMGYKFVRVANFTVHAGDEQFLVQVEKASGKLFEVKSSKLSLQGTVHANAYHLSYLEPHATLPLGHLHVEGGQSTTNKRGEFQFDDARGLGIRGLKGKFVEIASLASPGLVLTASNFLNSKFHLDYIDEKPETAGQNQQVAQIMAYYHLTRIASTARQYVNIPWLNKPVLARVNVANTPGMRCNAYWNRLEQNINLIEHTKGLCANAALVADISYHEWGHGLHQNAGGIKDRALSEGFGDTMSMLFTRSAKLGKGFLLDGRLIRDAEQVVSYPVASEDPHRIGMALSGAMWELFKSLRLKYGEEKGTDAFANLAFKMIFTSAKLTDAYLALLNLDDDNSTLSDLSPNFCLINAAFASRNLATPNTRQCKK